MAPSPSSRGSGRQRAPGTTCPDGSPFPSDPVPALRTARLWDRRGRGRAGVTYQFWLSSYGFHTKILTFLRGATGHSTFPSRLRVMLALAALSGRECHPGCHHVHTTSSHGRGGARVRKQKTRLSNGGGRGNRLHVSASPMWKRLSTSTFNPATVWGSVPKLLWPQMKLHSRTSQPGTLPPAGGHQLPCGAGGRSGAPTPVAPMLLTRGRHWLPQSLMLTIIGPKPNAGRGAPPEISKPHTKPSSPAGVRN